jgi:hypothetical protein
MPWNFGYYQKFFEDYGFQLYFKQYTYMRPVQDLGFDGMDDEREANVYSNNPPEDPALDNYQY